jgi:hypothetical protein
MNSVILRARYMTLALLVIAVVHGHLQAVRSGATHGSSGLTRLNRDLMRLAGSEAAEWRSSRNGLGT